MTRDELTGVLVLVVASLIGGLFIGHAKGHDTSDRKLEQCIAICQDKVASYTPALCVCASGLKLEGE